MSRGQKSRMFGFSFCLLTALGVLAVGAWIGERPAMAAGADDTPSAWAIQKIPRVAGPDMSPDSGGLLVGPVRMHGGMSVLETYTDNYFLEKNEKKNNWFTTYSPFFLATLGQNRHNVELEYRGDLERNQSYTQYDIDHHYLNGRMKLDFPGGLLITGGHEYMIRSNMPDNTNDIRKKYVDNVSSINSVYTFADRYSVGATYSHGVRRFDLSAFNRDDYDRDDVSVAVYYRVLPKTRFFVEYGWNGTSYEERKNPSYDSSLYRYFVGVRTEATAKLAGQIKGGLTKKDYTDNTVTDDINGWGLEGEVEYLITSKTPLTLSVYRKNEDTQFSTLQNPVYGASYDRTGVALRLRHEFSERLSARARVGYEAQDYHKPKGSTGDERNDKVFFTGAGVEYKIWEALYLGVDYLYQDDNSNIEGTGYTENRLMFSLTLGY